MEKATSAISSIPSFLKALEEVLQTPFGWITLLVLVVWLFLNKDFSHLFDLAERKKKNRLRDIESYISNSEQACNETLSVLKDLRDTYYFESATGIFAEKHNRKKVIDLYNATAPNINWQSIKRAMEYLEFSAHGPIEIKRIRMIDKISYWYNFSIGLIMILLAAILLIAYLLDTDKTLSNTFAFVASFIITIGLGLYSASQNWPLNSAKKIKKELERNKLTKSQNYKNLQSEGPESKSTDEQAT